MQEEDKLKYEGKKFLLLVVVAVAGNLLGCKKK